MYGHWIFWSFSVLISYKLPHITWKWGPNPFANETTTKNFLENYLHLCFPTSICTEVRAVGGMLSWLATLGGTTLSPLQPRTPEDTTTPGWHRHEKVQAGEGVGPRPPTHRADICNFFSIYYGQILCFVALFKWCILPSQQPMLIISAHTYCMQHNRMRQAWHAHFTDEETEAPGCLECYRQPQLTKLLTSDLYLSPRLSFHKHYYSLKEKLLVISEMIVWCLGLLHTWGNSLKQLRRFLVTVYIKDTFPGSRWGSRAFQIMSVKH